jgi:hypothetical protein
VCSVRGVGPCTSCERSQIRIRAGHHDATRFIYFWAPPKPVEERVEVALAYMTRFFRRRPEHLGGDIAAIIPPTPNGKRGGVMLAQEGERWTVTLIGHFGEVAPPELDGFIAFSRTIPAPYIYEVIKDAEPASEPEAMRFPATVRRRYEKLDRFPEGYLVFGACQWQPLSPWNWPPP